MLHRSMGLLAEPERPKNEQRPEKNEEGLPLQNGLDRGHGDVEQARNEEMANPARAGGRQGQATNGTGGNESPSQGGTQEGGDGA